MKMTTLTILILLLTASAAAAFTYLAGYRIYYGTASGVYDGYIPVDGATNLQLDISTLATGTYYFACTSVDVNGAESDYSNEISGHVPDAHVLAWDRPAAYTDGTPLFVPVMSVGGGGKVKNMGSQGRMRNVR